VQWRLVGEKIFDKEAKEKSEKSRNEKLNNLYGFLFNLHGLDPLASKNQK
jgi:hypothetical protein